MTTELKLTIGVQEGESRILDRFFTSPLKLATPHTDYDRLNVVLMMASPGMLRGDEHSYDIRCMEASRSMLTEQSYTKIFDTGEGKASRRQRIVVDQGASLFYRPCVVIPFRGSSYEGEMQVELSAGSEFAYVDILAAGRIGMGEQFAFRRYHNRISVQVGKKLVWIDNCLLDPAQMELGGMVYFDGYSHMGTFYYYGDAAGQERLREYLAMHKEYEDHRACIYAAMSQAREGICIRVLAHMAQDIEEFFAGIACELKLLA